MSKSIYLIRPDQQISKTVAEFDDEKDPWTILAETYDLDLGRIPDSVEVLADEGLGLVATGWDERFGKDEADDLVEWCRGSEVTFETVIEERSNSLVVIATKELKKLGIKRGDKVNVTIRLA